MNFDPFFNGLGAPDRLWETGNIVKLVEDAEPKPSKRDPYREKNSN